MPEFPAEVEAAAAKAAANPRLPDVDRTEIPFVTIDPEGAMDLDQALHIERGGELDPFGDGHRPFFAKGDHEGFREGGETRHEFGLVECWSIEITSSESCSHPSADCGR